jgi:hypothetical protein
MERIGGETELPSTVNKPYNGFVLLTGDDAQILIEMTGDKLIES